MTSIAFVSASRLRHLARQKRIWALAFAQNILSVYMILVILIVLTSFVRSASNSNVNLQNFQSRFDIKFAAVPATKELNTFRPLNLDVANLGAGSVDSTLPNVHAAAMFTGAPYTGSPISLPGRIEAENYDIGGEGVAYHDVTTTNDGGYYRAEGVDICSCGSPYGLSVGWTQPGEWMEYTVSVASYGSYKFQALTATIVSGSALHIEVDGVNVTGQMTLPNTNAWSVYAATSSAAVTLTPGQHIVRVAIDVTGFLFDSVDVIRLNTPYSGIAPQLPGTIQAENFDNGGEGIAYHDTTATNDGGAYRSEGVDLCFCGNSTGAALGWSFAGEWTKYTVNVSTTDNYTLQAKMSTTSSGNTIHFELDGVNVTGPIVLPNTGWWDNWTAIAKPNVQILAGQHELKMVIETGGFLFDSFDVLPSVPVAPSALMANAVSSTQINLSWADNSFNETGFKLERKTGPTGSYSEITITAAGVNSFSDTGLQTGTQYYYRLRATNLGGNSGYSNEASAMTSNLLPAVSLILPSAGTVFNAPANITVNASASDPDGTVSKVEFFQGSTKLGEDLTAPYSFSWTSVGAGTYNLTAKATDNLGGITTSASVAITVNALPTISLTAPAANTVFNSPANITITASASDSDGTISKVEFYQGTTKIGEDVASPFAMDWNNVPHGCYSLSAKTIDDRGALTTSATVPITVVGNSTPRLDPMNRTGGGSEDPLSRNFNWNLPLVNLPGRAGMDLGLTLSYNSLVWTRSGNSISFDDDNGFPGPGFRLGFPVIQPFYHNSEADKNAYLLIGSDGSRTELRQVGNSFLFESADSTHILLDTSLSLPAPDNDKFILRTTDGTRLLYALKGSNYQCTEIKDRNGNYISISYTALGHIDTVTDTLARNIKFNYDANGWLTSITQVWNQTSTPVTHYWARFEYTNTLIDTNFPALNVFGPADNSTIKTVSKVTLADDSHFDFSYTSWGQIWKISSFAPDNHLLNYRSYNLPQTGGGGLEQSDCPRFTERREWTQYWNGDTDGTPATNEEAITAFEVVMNDSWTMPDGSSRSGVRAQVTAPDLTVHKIYFIGTAGTASGWQRGLPALVNTYDSGGALQRQAMTTWTQDDTTVLYPLNARVIETNTYDPSGNRARVQMNYQQVTFADGTSCQLPRDVYEYAANASTILRSTRTDYNMSATYTDRHIISLVSEQRLYEGDLNNGGVLMSKVGFFYDESGSIQGTDAPVQHDNSNYGSSFVTGRANLSSLKRYDVTNTSQLTTVSSKYNTAGAVVSTKDALNHEVQLSYTDLFSDNNSRNTLAYPTTVTDGDGYTSTTKYHFDFGAVTYTRTPQPNTTQNLPGPERTVTYDTIGRVQQIMNLVNSAYTRFEYPTSGIRLDTFTTIQEGLGEAHSFRITDGHGRVIGSATDHPGSIGGFSSERFVYDVMDRVIKTSNPTETSASGTPFQWVAAGDDAAAGWIYTEQTYDWKGRPLTTTNQDGTTITASYTGCGCAGGEVVTLTDEGTLVNGITKRRQQKVYSDVFGRAVKREQLNWDGPGPDGTGGSTYAAITTTYNARDQVTFVRHYKGSTLSSEFQESSVTYDGFGRRKTQHTPEQQADPNNSASSDHTTWNYNSDDTVQSIVDARGVITRFSNNSRHLITAISYDKSNLPAGTIVSATANVDLSYDAVGNRTSLIDSSGVSTYHYDQLYRMDWEERTFTELSAGGAYRLSYEYNLAGLLKKVTDQRSSTSFTQELDRVGRVIGVTAVGYGGVVTQFISQAQYRASGSLKSEMHGNGTNLSFAYNNRGDVIDYSAGSGIGASYQYYSDGRPKFVNVRSFNGDGSKDRAYSYDSQGRLAEAYSGSEARNFVNNTSGGTADGSYRRSYTYDEWSNVISDTGRYWSRNTESFVGFDSTNRNPFWSYDSEGNLLSRNELVSDFGAVGGTPATSTFDSAGRDISGHQERAYWIAEEGGVLAVISANSQTLDANGRVTHYDNTLTTTFNGNNPVLRDRQMGFWVRSTVLGGLAISEYDAVGWKQTFVYSGTERIGRQSWSANGATSFWHHSDSITSDEIETDPAGSAVAHSVLDPQGINLGDSDPFPTDGSGDGDGIVTGDGSALNKNMAAPLAIEGGGAKCILDGIELDCGFVRGEATSQCPNNDCGAKRVRYQGRADWAFFQSFADGYAGYVPSTARYVGNGGIAPAGSGGRPKLKRFTDLTRNDTDLGQLNGAVGPEDDLRYTDPQEPVTENPATIDNSKAKDQACRIEVLFTGSGSRGLQNGPSTMNLNNRGQVFGIGFTVRISGLSGPINIVNEAKDRRPKTAWNVEQYVADFNKSNGGVVRQDPGARLEELRRAAPIVSASTVEWWDHPGTAVAGNSQYFTKRNFYIKAYRGKQHCEVSFHLTFRLFFGKPQDTGWGDGPYP